MNVELNEASPGGLPSSPFPFKILGNPYNPPQDEIKDLNQAWTVPTFESDATSIASVAQDPVPPTHHKAGPRESPAPVSFPHPNSPIPPYQKESSSLSSPSEAAGHLVEKKSGSGHVLQQLKNLNLHVIKMEQEQLGGIFPCEEIDDDALYFENINPRLPDDSKQKEFTHSLRNHRSFVPGKGSHFFPAMSFHLPGTYAIFEKGKDFVLGVVREAMNPDAQNFPRSNCVWLQMSVRQSGILICLSPVQQVICTSIPDLIEVVSAFLTMQLLPWKTRREAEIFCKGYMSGLRTFSFRFSSSEEKHLVLTAVKYFPEKPGVANFKHRLVEIVQQGGEVALREFGRQTLHHTLRDLVVAILGLYTSSGQHDRLPYSLGQEVPRRTAEERDRDAQRLDAELEGPT